MHMFVHNCVTVLTGVSTPTFIQECDFTVCAFHIISNTCVYYISDLLLLYNTSWGLLGIPQTKCG